MREGGAGAKEAEGTKLAQHAANGFLVARNLDAKAIFRHGEL
jgi:hypothetical protein